MGKRQKDNNTGSSEPMGSLVVLGHKAFDQVNGTSITSTGTVTSIGMPAQGLAYNQRVADRIKLDRIDFSFNLLGNSANNSDVVRCVVVQEIGASTGAPTITQILQSSASQSALLYNMNKLYDVLYDHSFSLTPNGDSFTRAIRLNLKPGIKGISFVAGSTTPYSGQIYVLWLSGNSTNAVIANTYWRLWFVDSD